MTAEPAATLPERLFDARERKGVDLYRAERDTKIRARYLAALERGDWKDLPGAVYTKGFLRNYALYLGLDPDDILNQWRRERGADALATPAITVPRPISAPRQGLTFSVGIVVSALLTVIIVLFIGYIGIQLFRFAKPPTIAVTDPADAVSQVDDSVTSYTLAGTSIPGATVEISQPGRDQPYRVTADPDGRWTAPVDLRRGRNQFEITAKDPDTGKVADQTVSRVITVPFLVIQAPTLTVDSPADGSSYENGAIPVQGTTTNATSVAVSAQFVGAVGPGVPTTSPATGGKPVATPPPPPVPQPQTVTPSDDGSFSAPLELSAGRWSITVTASSAENKTVSLTRAVTVNYKGVNLVVSIKGGRAWLKVWVDGQLSAAVGAAGRIYSDGKVLTFTGQESVEVRTGSSGVTSFTLNGKSLGALGRSGSSETWLFGPTGAPKQTGHK
jgi:cytoskeletal protein RodZ